MSYMGDYNTGAIVRKLWSTVGTDSSSITRATDGTLKIYKDGSATQRTSLSGVTQTEDFDGDTGVHYIAIDLSDDTDAGFYAAGHDYDVVMSGMTIDGKTVNAPVLSFSIANRSSLVSGDDVAFGAVTMDSFKVASFDVLTTNEVQTDATGYVKISEGTGTGQLKVTGGKPWALDSNGAVFSGVTGGLGASPVAITVNDGTNPIEGAVISLYSNGVLNGYASTNVSGVATLTPDSGDITYDVYIRKASFSFTPTTLAVSGATSHTYSMTRITITPTVDPTLTTLKFTAYNNSYAGAAGIEFEFVLDTPGLTTGYSFPRDTKTAISGTAGATQVDLLRSSTYKGRRLRTDGTPGDWVDITTGATDTTQAPGILGAPQD